MVISKQENEKCSKIRKEKQFQAHFKKIASWRKKKTTNLNATLQTKTECRVRVWLLNLKCLLNVPCESVLEQWHGHIM